MTDADAFERAILAEPAADLPRLVYADWLDETGDPANAARAEYIRLQCEAAGLSDLDVRRHRLERRASVLFHAHWMDWWRPICQRLNLPEPANGPGVRVAGQPYFASPTPDEDIVMQRADYSVRWPPRALVDAQFGRGFVDYLDLSGRGNGGRGPSVADWLAAVPATGLLLRLGETDFAPDDTPALNKVRRLELMCSDAVDAAACLRSPHFRSLEELELCVEVEGRNARELRAVADTPAAHRLRRLTLQVGTPAAASVLGNVVVFGGLRDLTLTISIERPREPWTPPAPVPEATAYVTRFATAARRSQLQRLSLFSYGQLPPGGVQALTCEPWPLLRTLELLDPLVPDDVRALSADAFSQLAELFLVLEPTTANQSLDLLAQWPTVKRLTRLCFGGGTAKADPDRLVKLVAGLDLDVLQTFHLEPHADATLKERLSAILGDRLWMG